MRPSKHLNNREIATLLRNISAAYEVLGVDRFRIRAYDEAASSIETLSNDLRDVWEEHKLDDVAGIGQSLAKHLDELFKTGKVSHFEAVMGKLPKGMFPLLEITGIGPKSAFSLAKHLKLSSTGNAILELKKACERGKVAGIEGFGQESQRKILESISDWQRKEDRMLLPVADSLADSLKAYLEKNPSVSRIESLGSLRRRAATVRDIDLAVASDDPQKVIALFIAFPKWRKVLVAGKNTARAIHQSGRQIDVKVESPERFGSLLQHFTGSKDHNVRLREIALTKGMSVSDHGIKVHGKLQSFANEQSFYGYLSMQWIPPELRENRGEIERALKRQLPVLVDQNMMKGDLHVHSNIDIEPSHDLGATSLIDLARASAERGYEYLGISDHNPAVSTHNKREIIELIKMRNDIIDNFNSAHEKSMKIRVLKSLEIDILPDGKRSVPDEGLELLDVAIVSIHSSFQMNRIDQTRRVLRALDHPRTKIFGHPTARVLLVRQGVEYDWDMVFDFCKTRRKWIEVNGSPARLDLPDHLIRDAIEHDVRLVISSDSHHVDHLAFMKYGVDQARRGWATRRDVMNTLGYNQLLKELR